MNLRSNKSNELSPHGSQVVDPNNNGDVDLDQLSEESRALYMLLADKFDNTINNLELRIKEKDIKIDLFENRVCVLEGKISSMVERLDESENSEVMSQLPDDYLY